MAVVHRVVIVAFEGAQSLDVAGPAEVFAGVNTCSRNGGNPRLALRRDGRFVDGGRGRHRERCRLMPRRLGDRERIDTLSSPVGSRCGACDDDRFTVAVADLIARCRPSRDRLFGGGVGRRGGHRLLGPSRHHALGARRSARRGHPDITVDADPIYIHSHRGRTRTTRRVDLGRRHRRDRLCLAVVEADHGTENAQEVARWLVMYLRRPGGQSQFASPTWTRQAPPPGRPFRAQDLVVADPGADHRVAVLAEAVGDEPPSLRSPVHRRGRHRTGQFVAAVRIDAARHELERSDDTVGVVARCGLRHRRDTPPRFHRHASAPMPPSPLTHQPPPPAPPHQNPHSAESRVPPGHTTRSGSGSIPRRNPMSIQVVIPLFPKFTALDGIGPTRCSNGCPTSTSPSSPRAGRGALDNAMLGIRPTQPSTTCPTPTSSSFPGGAAPAR